MRRLARIAAAVCLAIGVAVVARGGEEPLRVNEGPRLAPGIVFSEASTAFPLSVSLWRSTWGQAEPEPVLVGRVFGPWTDPGIHSEHGQELVRSWTGMSTTRVIFATTRSEVFLGWVDPAIAPPDSGSGLSEGMYSYRFVFHYDGGRADTLEAGILIVAEDGIGFDRGGVKLFEER